jgi:hypothetical protein
MNKLILRIAVLALLAAPAAAQVWEASAGADAAAQIARVRSAVKSAPSRPAAAPLPSGSAHQPAALKALLDLVGRTARAGKTPVVMFDLDDTLIDTGYRQMAIIKEYAAQADVRARFPGAADKMGAIRYGDLHYDIGDTLKALGVAETGAILPELTAFWAARFFDNGYLQLDHANPGGVDYVREVLRRGGKAVYLTGRWEAMRPGTAQSMARMGYPPADGQNVILMMKPDRAQSDIDFKKVAFGDIAGLGQVVGGFENEPANVNAYQERFQTGIYIFLDTRHSTTAAVPLPSIFWIGDFRY